MKKLLLILVAMLSFSLVTVSCSSKAKKINELNELAEDMSKNASTWTPEQWEECYQKFDTGIAELEKESLSDEEKQQVGDLKKMVGTLKGMNALKNKLGAPQK